MRPPKPFTKENEKRRAVIDAAIKRVGLKHLSEVHGVLPWSIHKWRNAGRVPADQLELFCKTTELSPWDVCDPALLFMQTYRHKPNLDTTKSGAGVNRVEKK